MSEFEKQKEAEMRRLQELKAEEMRKLRKEKKVFEEYQKNMFDKPNKKEREEIDALKQQVILSTLFCDVAISVFCEWEGKS